MNVKGIEYEVKSSVRIGTLEKYQDDPSIKNQILLIQDILSPSPSIEEVREMDTEDFGNVMVEFGRVSQNKNAEYKKKLSI
ncbi:MAG: hypothetical protein GY853_16750 [PVC group bacterium]|nr:hypothetical protein [PVC group bacterium]